MLPVGDDGTRLRQRSNPGEPDLIVDAPPLSPEIVFTIAS
jgi:hypothetical protein